MKSGELLRRARQEKGLSLGQVAKDLYVQEKYIQAIEEGNFEVIPGEAYQRAYFKKYADYLGLGDLFDRLSKSPDIDIDEEKPRDESIFGGKWDTGRWVRVITKLALIVLIPTLLVLGVKARQSGKPDADNRERRSGTQILEVVPTDTTAPTWQPPQNTSSPDATPKLDNLAHKITLRAMGQCWVSLTTRDGSLYAGNMQAGDVLNFSDLIGFKLRAGAPEKLEVELDGEVVPWEAGETEKVLPPGAAVNPADQPSGDSGGDTN